MNVYIYGGTDRNNASESIISGNGKASVGETYTIDYQTGILVIAFPNEGIETEFKFTYRLVASTTVIKY